MRLEFTPEGTILIADDGTRRELNEGEDQETVAAAFRAEHPDKPGPVPQSVSPANFCIALDQLGLLDEVEAYVATLPRAAQIKWQRATSIDRDNPLIAAAAQSENWSVEQVDGVFRLAGSLASSLA